MTNTNTLSAQVDAPRKRSSGPRRNKHHKGLYTFSAPAGIEEALRPHLAEKKKPKTWLQKCLYVAAAIKERQYERSVESEDWVPLWSKILDEIIGADYRVPVIKLLEDAGVIQQCRSWRVGRPGKKGESMRYRFRARFCDAPVVPVVIDDRFIVRNLAQVADRRRKAIDRDDLLRPMRRALARFHVEDWPEDREELRRGREQGFGLNLKREGVGQRAYHDLTNWARELRQHGRVDGKPIWAADCSCSQPLLLGLFFQMAQEGHLPDDLPPVLKAAAKKLPTVDSDELDRYVRDCCRQEGMYDDVAKTSDVPRILVKLGWMTRAFGVPEEVAEEDGWAEQLYRSRDPVARQVGRAFLELYPSVYGCLKQLWRTFGRGGLPKLLQRFESWIYLDRLTARLHAEYPQAVFTSVHDSILGDKETVEKFKAEVEHEYRVLFGVVPLVKVELWSKPQPAKTCYEQVLFEHAPEALKDEAMKWLARKLTALDKKHPAGEEPSSSIHKYIRSISAKVLPYYSGIESTGDASPSESCSSVGAVPGQVGPDESVELEQVVACKGDEADYEKLLVKVVDLVVENDILMMLRNGHDEPSDAQLVKLRRDEERVARMAYPSALSLRKAIWVYETDDPEGRCPYDAPGAA